MRRRIVLSIGAALIVVLSAVGWLVLREDAPPPLSVDDVTSAGGATATATSGLEGTWTVVVGGESQAGLRIEEDRFGGLSDNTAVGRTTAVSGSLTVEGDEVAAGSFTIDLSKIEFTDDPGISVANRSEYLRTKALETDRYPTATFELTKPLPLPALRTTDEVAVASITGELTLHGVTKPATFEVQAKRSGNDIVLATAAPVPVELADHDIEVPVIKGVSEVRGAGEFEFVVVLRRS